MRLRGLCLLLAAAAGALGEREGEEWNGRLCRSLLHRPQSLSPKLFAYTSHGGAKRLLRCLDFKKRL